MIKRKYHAALIGGRFKSEFKVIQPLGICSIASYCRKQGKKIMLVNPSIWNMNVNETLEHLLKSEFSILGISIHCDEWGELQKFMELARKIKTKRPAVFICVGGFGVGSVYKSVLKSYTFIDCVMLGDGEHRFLELINCIEKGNNWMNIDAIAYMIKNKLILTKCPPATIDLRTIPFPAMDFIEEELKNNPKSFVHYEIFSKRGCLHNCSFCSLIRNQKLYGKPGERYRTIESVIEEIKTVYRRFKITRFRFRDENFIGAGLYGREYFYKLCNEIALLDFSIKFSMQTRIDTINEKSISTLKEAGCVRVFLGIESFSQQDLNLYQKGIELSVIKEKLDIMKRYGFSFSRDSIHRIAAGMMIWNPYSSGETLIENAKMARIYELPPKKMRNRLIPFEKTNIWNKMKEDNLVEKPGLQFSIKIIGYAYRIFNAYFESEIYRLREKIRAIEKIALWKKWTLDERFEVLKFIRNYIDNKAYDLLERIGEQIRNDSSICENELDNILHHIEIECNEVIKELDVKKVISVIMVSRNLSENDLSDANRTIEF